jgi:hypothetical protein
VFEHIGPSWFRRLADQNGNRITDRPTDTEKERTCRPSGAQGHKRSRNEVRKGRDSELKFEPKSIENIVNNGVDATCDFLINFTNIASTPLFTILWPHLGHPRNPFETTFFIKFSLGALGGSVQGHPWSSRGFWRVVEGRFLMV